MRVTAYAPIPATGPSTRYRLAQLAGPLAERGVRLRIDPFFDEEAQARAYGRGIVAKAALLGGGLVRRVRTVGGADADVALVHRELAPALNGLLLRRLAGSGRPMVFDFDDAIWLRAPGGDPLVRLVRRPEAATAAFCRAAVAVMAGNEHLARWAREARGGPEGVHVVPTVVDTDRFRPGSAGRGRGGPPVVGWVGSHTTLPYLEALDPVLARVRARSPFRLVVVADRPPTLRTEHEFVAWTPEREVESVRELDVGLYPLPDDPWTRGKCGFKAIQYMACGVPVVASPVGVLQDLVTPGETGFLAADDDAWEAALERLLGDPAARRGLGARARERVVAGWSVAAVIDGVAAILRSAAATGAGAARG